MYITLSNLAIRGGVGGRNLDRLLEGWRETSIFLKAVKKDTTEKNR